MATVAEFLDHAATETLYVGGQLAAMLSKKKGIRRAVIEDLIERLNNARGSLESIIR